MNIPESTLRQVREALSFHTDYDECSECKKALTAIDKAMSAPEPEPVAVVGSWWNGGKGFDLYGFKGKRPEPGTPLIPAPPKEPK